MTYVIHRINALSHEPSFIEKRRALDNLITPCAFISSLNSHKWRLKLLLLLRNLFSFSCSLLLFKKKSNRNYLETCPIDFRVETRGIDPWYRCAKLQPYQEESETLLYKLFFCLDSLSSFPRVNADSRFPVAISLRWRSENGVF